MGYQMTSRDPQRCCEAVRSAVLATAWFFDLFYVGLIAKISHTESSDRLHIIIFEHSYTEYKTV